MSQNIKISATPSPTKDVCLFTLSETLLESGSLKLTSAQEAKNSPLLSRLFSIGAVVEILVRQNTLTLRHAGPADWQVLGKAVGQILREELQKPGPLFAELAPIKESTPQSFDHLPPGDEELRKQVLKILEEQVTPALASHGGHVKLEGIRDHQVYLRFGGGCQGCGMADVTVKEGIEKLLKSKIPSLKAVVDVTDHAQGTNPYYQS